VIAGHKTLIIPFFIGTRGCPHRCIFCNERITAGDASPVSAEGIERMVTECLKAKPGEDRSRKRTGTAKAKIAQIAFYGGNFTGLPTDDQVCLLRMAQPYIERGLINGIRISTRPDYIDCNRLELLKKWHVTTVEIGAQSLVDDVLAASERGHSAADVSRAVRLLKAQHVEVGLHLMVGLPGDSREYFYRTVGDVIDLAPDTVRIHPTLVFQGTPLAEAFYREDYQPLTMEAALERCMHARRRFQAAGIPVIRLGLQSTPEMETPGAVVAGPYHPAFGALVASADFLDQSFTLLGGRDWHNRWVTFFVPPRLESAFRGVRNENLRILTERFHLAGISVTRGETFCLSDS